MKRKAGLEERKKVLVGFECLLSMGSEGVVCGFRRLSGWVGGRDAQGRAFSSGAKVKICKARQKSA